MNKTFIPARAVIRKIVHENDQISTFRLELIDQTLQFTFFPGQFLMVSVPHCGEAAISISSSPDALPLIDLSIRRAGELTTAIHAMKEGDQLGLRGPFGNAFPVDSFAGHNLLFVAGGIGLAPLKSVIDHCLFQSTLKEKNAVQDIRLLYGSRSPSDIAFTKAIKQWQKRGMDVRLTVDEKDTNWDGHKGLVTDLLDDITIDTKTIAIICGPPIMIRFVIAKLTKMGCDDTRIFTTLERHMKCGMGLCGHCHLDGKLVCLDGPVFSVSELQTMDVMELS